MNEQLKFYKGFESDLPKDNIEPGVLYHCTDTGNTYRGTDTNTLELFSSAAGKITYDDNGSKNIIFDSDISCFQGDVYVNGTDLENKNTQKVATEQYVKDLLGIEEEFYEVGEPLVLNLEQEKEISIITKISRPESSPYYDATKLTLYQDLTNNIIDVANMFGGPGTVIEKNGLTLTINNDGTATITGTSTEATLFEAKVTDSSFIYPPGTYRVPYGRMMLSGFAVNGGNFGGNRWGAKDHTISDPFVLFRIFLDFAANKTFNDTFPINIPILNLSYDSDNIYSNKIKYTVDFGRVVTNGEYNWTTGELKDEYENIIAYYPKQVILGFQGFNAFWTGFGNVIGQNKSNTLEKITVLLNEQIPEDAMTSVCDFILKPTTVQAAYGLGNWNLINPAKELSGTEVPLISTKGYLTVQDKDGNIKYNKYLDSMYNHREVSDELTPKGLYKKWSEKFYLTKPPISQTNVGSVWDGSPQMIVYEWEFDKNEFETTGIPAKIQDIPIVTPCFWNDSTSATKIAGAQMYNTTPYPAVFSYDYETDKYKLTAKGVTGFSINALLTQYSKVYFYYQLETPYLENYYFAMGVGPEDTVTFIPDFSEAQPYIDITNVYQNFNNFLTEFNIDPQVSIFVPRNEYDALSGMSNIAIMLNNENSAAGGDSTVQGYSWIGEGDGVSDYTIQIQQKIDEIYKVSKGGTINLGPGTYKINNSLIIYENTIIQGNGHTIIEQTADNTHAVILSGSNISLRDLTIKLSGACTEETACIFANSDNHPTYGGHWDEKYPQNMYVQFCSAINVTLIGTYSMSSANGYYYLSDEAKAYRGYGFKGYGLYFNYFTCVNLTGRHLFSVVGGSSGSRVSVTATECRYGVYPGIANSVIEITGHSYYGNGENGTMINASESLVRTSSCYSIYLARSYDSQHYDIVIFFDEQSMGNTCIPNIEMSHFSNVPEYHSVSQALNKSFINYGRANSIPGYQETHPFFVGNRYWNLMGQSLINPQLHGSVDNALAGAGVWGEITSNVAWNEDYLSLSEICRYPQDAKNLNSHRAGMPTLLSTVSPSEENPIEIIIDITKRPVMTFQNLWIQFNHNYVASDFSIQTAGGNGNWHDNIRYFVNNREPIFYYMMHQDGSEFQINKIRIIITKAQVIPGLTGMRSDHVVITKDYNPEGLIGICNVGMTHGDAFGRAFLGECGGSLYGNVDMHQNTLKNLPNPIDDGDAVSKAYIDNYTIEKTQLISIFQDLKNSLANSNINEAIAVLDNAILDLSKLM